MLTTSPLCCSAAKLENFLIKYCVIIEVSECHYIKHYPNTDWNRITLGGHHNFIRRWCATIRSTLLECNEIDRFGCRSERYRAFDCWLNLYLRHGVAFLIFRPVIRPSGVWHECAARWKPSSPQRDNPNLLRQRPA